MIDLFEFEVRKHSGEQISDLEVTSFFDFLETRSLFWGGGGDDTSMRGCISVPDDSNFDIAKIVGEFADYFGEEFTVDTRVLVSGD